MSKFCLLTFSTILVLLFVNISAEPKPDGIDIIVNNLRPEPQPKFLAASRPSPALRPEPQPKFLAASRPSPAKKARRSGRRSLKNGIDKIRL